MKIFVVIPGYNEQKYLARVLEKVSEQTKNIIYVDDGSDDRSAEIAERFTPHVLRHETNLGKGAAMLTGAEFAFKKCDAEAIIFMDADDQHDPVHLPEFFKQLKKFPAVFGVRNMGTNMPLFRFLGNKTASVLLNVLYGAYISDIPSGFKAMNKQTFRKVIWQSRGYEVETEIAARVAQHKIPFGVVEIRAIYHDTDKGMTLLDGLYIAGSLLKWRIGL